MSVTRGAIRVLIIDDSVATRKLCDDRLARESDILILGIIPDPIMAMRRIKADCPDVIVMDIEMSRANGLALLKQILAEKPTPVVIFSPQSSNKSTLAIEGMVAGAIASVKKPNTTLLSSLQHAGIQLSAAIREAARAQFRVARSGAPATLGLDLRKAQPNPANQSVTGVTKLTLPATKLPHLPGSSSIGTGLRPASFSPPPTASAVGVRVKNTADAMLAAKPASMAQPGGDRIIVIGASTGGTQALEAVLTKLPAKCPGIVIVQHMPERFTEMFANRLNELCKLEVREAVHGDKVQPGIVLVAPGGRHMMIKRHGAGYIIEISDGPLVNRHKPSVDLIFRSVAQAAGPSAVGFILTGMGDDGARGMKELHDSGAQTVAQDEFSCVVFGMPRVAIAMGGVDKIMSLDKIPQEIISYAH